MCHLFYRVLMAVGRHICILYILLHMRIAVHIDICVIAKVNAWYLRHQLKHVAAVARVWYEVGHKLRLQL